MTSSRLLSLDAFRGLTIAGMLLVNDPGSWSYVYPPLDHAEWNGWTPTDLIFPFFLFIVGISLTLSFARRLEQGASRADLLRKVLTRGLIIWALGLALAGFPRYDLSTIRIMGVLARIGVVYLATGVIYLTTGTRAQRWIILGLLVGYWAVMTLVPVPGYGAGVLERQGNLAQYVDALVLGAHRWKPDWDPEGIMSTFPAIATCLLGVQWGRWLQSAQPPTEKALGMFVGGALSMTAGEIWSIWFPINKNLWSSSYVLFTAGFALMVFGVLYYYIEIRGRTRWAGPLLVYGSNSILVFVLSGLFARILILTKVAGAEGTTVSLYTWLYTHAFQPWAGTYNGSLAFAITYVLLFFALMAALYRRKWFVKI
jgi:predicted acyltransferase